MANEELCLAEALGFVCKARAQVHSARETLERGGHLSLADHLTPVLYALKDIQDATQVELTASLRIPEEGP